LSDTNAVSAPVRDPVRGHASRRRRHLHGTRRTVGIVRRILAEGPRCLACNVTSPPRPLRWARSRGYATAPTCDGGQSRPPWSLRGSCPTIVGASVDVPARSARLPSPPPRVRHRHLLHQRQQAPIFIASIARSSACAATLIPTYVFSRFRPPDRALFWRPLAPETSCLVRPDSQVCRAADFTISTGCGTSPHVNAHLHDSAPAQRIDVNIYPLLTPTRFHLGPIVPTHGDTRRPCGGSWLILP
jgi:hypothetical protein